MTVPAAKLSGGARAVAIDLSRHLDNTGSTWADNLDGGAFNIWCNTFPAEELPPDGLVEVGGIPFRLAGRTRGRPDNLRCGRQLLAVPPGRYDWIHVLAAAERRTEDLLLLHYATGAVDPEWIRISDFWPETPPRFDETPALRFSRMHYPRHVQHNMLPVIWNQRVPVPRQQDLAGIRLPDNPAIHLFAVTCVPAVTEGETR